MARLGFGLLVPIILVNNQWGFFISWPGSYTPGFNFPLPPYARTRSKKKRTAGRHAPRQE